MMIWVIRYEWFRAFYQSVLIVRGESGEKLFSWLVVKDRHRGVR